MQRPPPEEYHVTPIDKSKLTAVPSTLDQPGGLSLVHAHIEKVVKHCLTTSKTTTSNDSSLMYIYMLCML